jgi:RNA polymerase sigma-70 factor (ECF subfamily)
LQDLAVALTLLERIAAGDARAVDECLEHYGGLIWSLARRFSPGYADAEDAVQEILLGVWRSASRFDPEVAAEAAFITTIAKRRLIDRHRRRGRRLDARPIEEESAIVARTASNSVEVQEEAERVRAVMGKLRDEERRVLEMSLVDGLTHSQISEGTSLPLGTVKTHARRGLNRLREMLGVNAPSPNPDP